MNGTQINENIPDFKEVWLMFQETNKKFQETNKKFQETDKKFQETDKKIQELTELFTGQWGKLVEALLGSGCIYVFKERGLNISHTMSNIKAKLKDRMLEIDVLLTNDNLAVLIEVKTTARVKHIKKLEQDLKEFKLFFPVYKDFKIFGAIAAVRYEENCDAFAESKGIFVIEPSGEKLVRIKNNTDFSPKGY
ncbi:MAG: hypothetical protein HY738_16795 [Bacteroidia bacterium]|nr:hypothetical protein [Bacteroidia bacterium]